MTSGKEISGVLGRWFKRVLRDILKLYVRLRFYRYQYWRRIEADLLDEIIEQMPKKYYDLAEEELARVRTWKENEGEEIERFTDHAVWDVLTEGESWIERYSRESASCHSRKERYVLDRLKNAELSLFRVEKRVDHFGAFVKDLLALNRTFFLWDPSMAVSALPGDLMFMRVICTGGIRMIANGTAYIFEEDTSAEISGVFEREVIKPAWAGKTQAREAVREQKSFFFRRMMEAGIPYEIYPFPGDVDDEEDDSDSESKEVWSRDDSGYWCPECREKHPDHQSHFPFSEQSYVRSRPKTGRNEPCPCGSGKKYKKCCEGVDAG